MPEKWARGGSDQSSQLWVMRGNGNRKTHRTQPKSAGSHLSRALPAHPEAPSPAIEFGFLSLLPGWYHHDVVLSRVSLLLLVYLTLDFANPLMPGAVQFHGGSVEVVQADRARPPAVVPIYIVPTSQIVLDHPDTVQLLGRPERATAPRRHAVIRIRRPPASSPDPAVFSEDH
jgi:hypothetical protein